MSFPRELLAGHEQIVFELRPHWIALLRSALWTVLAMVVGIVGYRIADARFNEPTIVDNAVVIVAIVLWLALAVPPAVRWRFTLFVLTTDRLITRSGVFAKHSKEIPLERINDVAFRQTVMERILKAGDLMIESAGERGQTRISSVRNPERVQLRIFEESEKNQDRMYSGGPANAERAPASIPEQLQALARLKDQGVLSEAEFEAKKQELLKRL